MQNQSILELLSKIKCTRLCFYIHPNNQYIKHLLPEVVLYRGQLTSTEHFWFTSTWDTKKITRLTSYTKQHQLKPITSSSTVTHSNCGHFNYLQMYNRLRTCFRKEYIICLGLSISHWQVSVQITKLRPHYRDVDIK